MATEPISVGGGEDAAKQIFAMGQQALGGMDKTAQALAGVQQAIQRSASELSRSMEAAQVRQESAANRGAMQQEQSRDRLFAGLQSLTDRLEERRRQRKQHEYRMEEIAETGRQTQQAQEAEALQRYDLDQKANEYNRRLQQFSIMAAEENQSKQGDTAYLLGLLNTAPLEKHGEILAAIEQRLGIDPLAVTKERMAKLEGAEPKAPMVSGLLPPDATPEQQQAAEITLRKLGEGAVREGKVVYDSELAKLEKGKMAGIGISAQIIQSDRSVQAKLQALQIQAQRADNHTKTVEVGVDNAFKGIYGAYPDEGGIVRAPIIHDRMTGVLEQMVTRIEDGKPLDGAFVGAAMQSIIDPMGGKVTEMLRQATEGSQEQSVALYPLVATVQRALDYAVDVAGPEVLKDAFSTSENPTRKRMQRAGLVNLGGDRATAIREGFNVFRQRLAAYKEILKKTPAYETGTVWRGYKDAVDAALEDYTTWQEGGMKGPAPTMQAEFPEVPRTTETLESFESLPGQVGEVNPDDQMLQEYINRMATKMPVFTAFQRGKLIHGPAASIPAIPERVQRLQGKPFDRMTDSELKAVWHNRGENWQAARAEYLERKMGEAD